MSSSMFEKVGDRLVNRFFRRVDGVVWDLMTGRVGVQTADGEIATLEGEGEGAEVSINVFNDFGVPLPAFAQSVPVTEIKQGDLIYNAKRVLGWVIGTPNLAPVGKAKATKTFKLLKPDGTRGEWSPAKLSSMGLELSGAMVLRSLVNMFPGGGLSGLQGSLMPLLMLGGGGDLEQMLPLLLMSGMGLGGTAAGAAGGMGNMMQMMLMMKMMGGSGFGSMFPGGSKAAGGSTKGNFFDR